MGGAIGAYVAGILWQDSSGAVITYDFAALTALFGGILALFLRNKPIYQKGHKLTDSIN